MPNTRASQARQPAPSVNAHCQNSSTDSVQHGRPCVVAACTTITVGVAAA